MIGILPKLYDDELLYSFLSRYSVAVGSSTYKEVAESIYKAPTSAPNILLLNFMTEDLICKLEPQASLTEVIMKHTLFKYFVQFARKERREKAFKFATEMHIKKLYDSLPIPNYSERYNENRVLQFCPICAREQRVQKGECYFQTFQQIFELTICPIHYCKLHKTNIFLDGSVSPSFISAESVIPQNNEIIYSRNELEISLAEYLLKVFKQPIDFDNKNEVGGYLDYRLQDKGYVKSNGLRNMKKLTDDFNCFYSVVGIKREYWFLQKIFSNYIFNPYEISLMGFFLNISPQDLCEHKTL